MFPLLLQETAELIAARPHTLQSLLSVVPTREAPFQGHYASDSTGDLGAATQQVRAAAKLCMEGGPSILYPHGVLKSIGGAHRFAAIMASAGMHKHMPNALSAAHKHALSQAAP